MHWILAYSLEVSSEYPLANGYTFSCSIEFILFQKSIKNASTAILQL